MYAQALIIKWRKRNHTLKNYHRRPISKVHLSFSTYFKRKVETKPKGYKNADYVKKHTKSISIYLNHRNQYCIIILIHI